LEKLSLTVQDVFDLRAARWKGAKATTTVKTIAEIHQEAAKEQAQKSAAAQQSMSRPGSRHGQPRAGDWQTTPSQAPRQRPTDFSGMGRLASANNTQPTFQPQSAFGKNKRGGANVSTPPISRQPSQANIAVNNANSFALLNEASEAAESSEPAPQRKKLQLAPRTKPVSGDEGEGEGEGEGDQAGESEESEGTEDEVTTPVQSNGMTETAALAKIQIDMNELWGEKGTAGSRNPDDIVHYFKALPEPRRPLLTTRLFDDVFRLAKLKDAQIIAKGLSAAVEDGVVDKESVKTG
jgi:translation initiation factor 4G